MFRGRLEIYRLVVNADRREVSSVPFGKGRALARSAQDRVIPSRRVRAIPVWPNELRSFDKLTGGAPLGWHFAPANSTFGETAATILRDKICPRVAKQSTVHSFGGEKGDSAGSYRSLP